MPTTAFTSWSDLHTSMLNALADFVAKNQFTKVKYRIETGAHQREMEYRSLTEFKKNLEWVKYLADLETGSVVRRTLGKSIGRP